MLLAYGWRFKFAVEVGFDAADVCLCTRSKGACCCVVLPSTEARNKYTVFSSYFLLRSQFCTTFSNYNQSILVLQVYRAIIINVPLS